MFSLSQRYLQKYFLLPGNNRYPEIDWVLSNAIWKSSDFCVSLPGNQTTFGNHTGTCKSIHHPFLSNRSTLGTATWNSIDFLKSLFLSMYIYTVCSIFIPGSLSLYGTFGQFSSWLIAQSVSKGRVACSWKWTLKRLIAAKTTAVCSFY